MHLQAGTLLVTIALFTSSTFAQGPALQSPVGQDKWAVGSDHVIRWNPVHIGDNAPLKAELSVDNRKTWSAINTCRCLARWPHPSLRKTAVAIL